MRYDNFRIQRKNQLTVSLKYFILVLLLMSFFHTSILSEKTRFGYPFGVPCLVFFCGGVLQRPQLAALGGYLGGFSQAFEQLALQPGYLHLGHAESAGNLGLGLPVEVAAHQDLPFPVIQGGQ